MQRSMGKVKVMMLKLLLRFLDWTLFIRMLVVFPNSCLSIEGQ